MSSFSFLKKQQITLRGIIPLQIGDILNLVDDDGITNGLIITRFRGYLNVASSDMVACAAITEALIVWRLTL